MLSRLVLGLSALGAAQAGVFSSRTGSYGNARSAPIGASPGDLGEPLLLSKVLTEEGPQAAKEKSAVVLPDFKIESYSGFLHTEDDGDKEMFFWYFPAQSGDKDAPLLIWLQGGPGGDSSFGSFVEMGPIDLDGDLRPHARNATWNKKYAMLFIDNPVGAGFSYTGTGDGYCTDSRNCVARNLVSLLLQFYKIFPESKTGGLYITGESYGGHYVPAFGAKVLEHNEKTDADDSIPLKGVAIGDGWIDPVNMIPGYPELMRNLALATEAEVRVIQGYCDRTVNYINQGDYLAAFEEWDRMLNGDVFPYPNYFHNITGSNNYDNFMMTNDPASFAWYADYLNQAQIRKAIHVGNSTFGKNAPKCEKALLKDFHMSYRPELQRLLTKEGVRVLVYSGQLDVIIASALTERFLPYLQWPQAEDFAAASKKVWRTTAGDKEVAGFVREIKDFQRVVVRGAGHIVPADQPNRAFDMITRFVEGKSYENLPNPATPSPSSILV
mmetsp:Transcript_34492/g.73491  ORF Transcript_34492/g.73491 Transcript_34492/m.73491 type:complete len:496 (-) Transcript_34492:358-1845(-)